jgi:hypothetical protein
MIETRSDPDSGHISTMEVPTHARLITTGRAAGPREIEKTARDFDGPCPLPDSRPITGEMRGPTIHLPGATANRARCAEDSWTNNRGAT